MSVTPENSDQPDLDALVDQLAALCRTDRPVPQHRPAERRMTGTTANPRYRNGHRRRQLRAKVLAEEDHCHICGRPVDTSLRYLDPWSAVLDELVPVSKGGNPFDRNNVRLAHRLCNLRRGDGTRQRPVVVPYVTSRRW